MARLGRSFPARPIFRRQLLPLHSNQLPHSEDFSASEWLLDLDATLVADATTPPSGVTRAFKVVEGTDTGNRGPYVFYPNGTEPEVAGGGNKTFSVHVKAAERTFAAVLLTSNGVNPPGAMIFVNLTTGVLGSPSGSQYLSSSITDAGSGWWRVSVTGTSINDVGYAYVEVETATALGTRDYTGDGSSGIYVAGAQFERGGLSIYSPTGLSIGGFFARNYYDMIGKAA